MVTSTEMAAAQAAHVDSAASPEAAYMRSSSAAATEMAATAAMRSRYGSSDGAHAECHSSKCRNHCLTHSTFSVRVVPEARRTNVMRRWLQPESLNRCCGAPPQRCQRNGKITTD
jgi:hypothetical protein